MAEQQSELDRITNTIEQAVYGKDVRSAIANGIRLCYKYVGGEAAIEAAIEARQAVDDLSLAVEDSVNVVNNLRQKTSEVDELVIISPDQPNSENNKIWIRPQADQEYKVATYDAYVALWERMNEFDSTYGNGHGGISSIDEDEYYSDPNDSLKRRFLITYADGASGEFFIRNGEQGVPGPFDDIHGYDVFYAVTDTVQTDPQTNKPVIPSAPTVDWDDEFPGIQRGKYLWTQTVLTFKSGEVAHLYNVCYQGVDGEGTVNSVQIGDGNPIEPVDQVVVLPIDTTPTAGNTGRLMSSAGIKNAIDNAIGGNVATQAPNDSSQKIANTAFVQTAVSGLKEELTAPKLAGKTFSIIGDSISSFFGYLPSHATDAGFVGMYPFDDVQTADDMWWGKVAEKTGMTLLKADAWETNRALNYGQDSTNWPARLTDGNTVPDYIFVYLGVNDWGSNVPLGEWPEDCPISGFPIGFSTDADLTFARSVAHISYWLSETFKQAKIYWLNYPEPYGNFTAFVPDNIFPRYNTALIPYTTNQANNIIRIVTGQMGIGMIDLRRETGINYFTESGTIKTFTSDGLHPNADGMERIADAVVKAIL